MQVLYRFVVNFSTPPEGQELEGGGSILICSPHHGTRPPPRVASRSRATASRP